MPRITDIIMFIFIIISLPEISLAVDKDIISVTIGEHRIPVTLLKKVSEDVVISAECVVPSDIDQIWSILTDYNNLGNIIPAVKDSRIIARNDKGIIVEQNGKSGFLIFRKSFSITYQVIEQEKKRIEFRAIKGDFKKFDGSWDVEIHEKGVLVHHDLEVKPDFYAPQWIMRLVTKKITIQSVENILKKCLTGEEKEPNSLPQNQRVSCELSMPTYRQ